MKNSIHSDLFTLKMVKRLLFRTVLIGSLAATTSVLANNISTSQVDLTKLIPDAPSITASSYILVDYNSGQILAEHNARERRNPASLTKMMTSYVVGHALKSEKIGSNDVVVISKSARSSNPKFKNSSLMFLREGEKVSVADLNRGIIIQSGNDACVALAEHVAGSEQVFIKLMNNFAESLNLKDTRFETVHGLDADNQYSTAYDMAQLGIALIRDTPEEYKIYNEKEFTFNKIRQTNRNRLLWDSSLKVDGIKTGHTSGAGYNLVSSASSDTMRLVAVVLGSQTEASRNEQSKQLLTWGFRFFETVTPLKANEEFASQRIWFGSSKNVRLGVGNDASLTIPRNRINDLKGNYNLNTKELHAPIKKGQVIGTIDFEMDGKVIQQQTLVALDDVEEGSFFSRLLDYIMLLFKRWFG